MVALHCIADDAIFSDGKCQKSPGKIELQLDRGEMSSRQESAVLEALKSKFGHSKFRSEEQKRAVLTVVAGWFLLIIMT